MARPEDRIKLFAITSQLIEQDLDRIEEEYTVDLSRGHQARLDQDTSYYPQIERDIRVEAAGMAPHYEVFYSLESSIRRQVEEALSAADPNWWQLVPEKIRDDAEKRQRKEMDSGVTPRSDKPLDFTTFGELGQIITQNWETFGAVFSSQKAVERVMNHLNTLRGPIAHCSPLAEDEVVRLRLSVRDWFRINE